MTSEHLAACSCCSHGSSVPHSVHQTLEEMDFERGIWSAAINSDLTRLKNFLRKGTDPSKPDQSGYTALHYASRGGDYVICEILLLNGANSNAQTKGGATPLHRAAYCGHQNIVELLLSHGANPQITDEDGMSPLHKAAERGHWEVCAILLEKNPGLKTLQDKKGRRARDLVQEGIERKQIL
ncbi:ankyrin repeat domain-containing protein 39 [Latimeria chalumnae]|uniref:Ankyrin repeat domain 39 n=1 Tax=Latimeria chalumnae TaxID=7897 RepID=H3B7D3_LATCH|nr:PREDICTED: ankyrin repeat domain-containing protein 39 [Latimeria chalumnae]|eukprot:XP_005995246.1 PREDICTED: ankyrin repeat domain-containing protein 39 [Latimeria chalumnae]